MKLTMKNCPACDSPLSSEDDVKEIFKRFQAIIKSHKDPYKKKMDLFKLLKSVEFKELEPLENKKIDYLLQSKLHAELAKQSMKQYEKLTAEEYSRAK